MNKKRPGKFVVSLDFELIWGILDKKEFAENYKGNIINVHRIMDRLLKLFDDYNIHATFATVGFLFFKNHQELLNGVPDIKPEYAETNLSPYPYINCMEKDEDALHYAHSLIQKIKSYPNQEIGTHTFSHYYCLEKGQNEKSFHADIESAIEIAKENGIDLKSLVFPRNQFNESYLKVCKKLGIKSYRGNENSWLYIAKEGQNETYLRRFIRLLDAYINISGPHTYDLQKMNAGNYPINIPSSRFLRPYSKRFEVLEPLKLKRIQSALTHAAQNSLVYHLYWHPHNFGDNIDENFNFLERIFIHFSILHDKYGMESMNMKEMVEEFEHKKTNMVSTSEPKKSAIIKTMS